MQVSPLAWGVTIAAIVGLLLVINLLCQVLLLAAGWIATGMDDIGVLADPHAEAERLRLLEEARLAEEAQLGSRRTRAAGRLRALASRLPRGGRR